MLLVLLVMYLNMGNMLLSVFILQMNDWWGFVIERISSDVLTNFTLTTGMRQLP